MRYKTLSACGLALVLVSPGLSQAGEVRLLIKDGRVTLSARDATLREILVEWERVGGTRIINRDRVSGALLTLELPGVPETQALATLLRPIAGYIAARRPGPEGGASQFSRIILMPGEAAPPSAAAPVPAQAASLPTGRPGVQRRVLPDGRVVTVMDDPDRGDDPDVQDEGFGVNGARNMGRPIGVPMRGQIGQPADDAMQSEPQAAPGAPVTSVVPTVPPTAALPGLVVPKPPGSPTQPGPPKPPGD